MIGSVGKLPLGLAALQRLLLDAVTAEGECELNGAAAPLADSIAENGLTALRRVAIYRHGYRARLVECLADDYPAVQHLLGPVPFEELCHDYIRDVPPGVSLNHYGARFADYCREHAPRHAPFAAELAELEWALVKAVHQSDARRLTPAELVALTPADWESASLVPSPTLTLLVTRYPVNAYLQAFRDDRAPAPPSPLSSWVVVCRNGTDVWRIELPPPIGDLFARLVSGAALGPTLADVSSSPQGNAAATDLASTIQLAFSQWMGAGCFSGIHQAASAP